jgi:beta-alanine--pyruvate transaminase
VVRQCRPLPPEDIVEAIQQQAAELDYAPPSRWAIPRPSSCPRRAGAIAPGRLDHVFFTNSGSEAVDTALKMALAYHRVRARARAPA